MCQHLEGTGQGSPEPLPPRASQSGGETRPVTNASLRAVMGQFGQGGGTLAMFTGITVAHYRASFP